MLDLYVFQDSLKLSQAVSKSSVVDKKHCEFVQIVGWAAKPWWLTMKVGKNSICHTYIIVTAAVNKWGAPNKKRDSSSSAASHG